MAAEFQQIVSHQSNQEKARKRRITGLQGHESYIPRLDATIFPTSASPQSGRYCPDSMYFETMVLPQRRVKEVEAMVEEATKKDPEEQTTFGHALSCLRCSKDF